MWWLLLLPGLIDFLLLLSINAWLLRLDEMAFQVYIEGSYILGGNRRGLIVRVPGCGIMAAST